VFDGPPFPEFKILKMEKKMVNFDDFSKLDLKIGKILEVSLHPEAEKLYL